MINTVLQNGKNINSGKVLMHEHVRCASNDLIHTFEEKWIDESGLIDFAAEILSNLREKYGLSIFVDGTPIDLGRDARILRAVSEKSGVDIVASSGLYYFENCYTMTRSEDEIASWFIDEFKLGIEGTDIKPGILKCASQDTITDNNRKRLRAMAIAQKQTNLPLYVHSNHKDDLAIQQIEILLEIIDNPEKILVGHSALKLDVEYLKKLLSYGCYIVVDQGHCSGYTPQQIGNALNQLCNSEYADRILLSNDMCIYSDFASKGYTGLQLTAQQHTDNFAFIIKKVYEEFVAIGGSEENWDKMFNKNPLKALNI